MKNRAIVRLVTILSLIAILASSTTSGFSQAPVQPGVEELKRDAEGEVEIIWNPLTDTPSFIRGSIPFESLGLDNQARPITVVNTLLERHAKLFGVKDGSRELKLLREEPDTLGMHHVTLGQIYQGIQVYGAYIRIHLTGDGREIVAISNGFIPGIQIPETEPRVSASKALTVSLIALPNGKLATDPILTVYPETNKESPAGKAILAWLVELKDDTLPARNVYVVDAAVGKIIDVIDRLYEGSTVSQTKVPPGRTLQQPVYNTAFLTDAQIEDYNSMTAEQIRAFLANENSYFRQSIPDVDGVVFDPPTVIAEAAGQYRINPQVILATLQKESSGVTQSSRPSDTRLSSLMGCSWGETAREQLECAAERFRDYHDQLTNSGSTVSGWQVGIPKTTQDGVTVTPATKAVAGQFTYTPYAGVQWGGNQPDVGGVYLFYYAWNEFGFNTNQPGIQKRETYDADHEYVLPGALVRAEGDDPTGDQDVDNAHDFAGQTYDYYWITHQRDSFDDNGAKILSTANYGRDYMNAFWNGEQMVYGDYFAVRDVVAHELTHAVTEYSANLEYRWQSGALNESFSDIFGAMVDRDDWLMGEDLPPHLLAGREAIRDLSNPPRFGQPEHTDDWVETCSDNEGVHTNSGITNKAFYYAATTIGKDKAERIFYRALTIYLDATSSLEDTRAAALQSAADLFGQGSTEYNGVLNGFNSVGLDGVWNPPTNDCTCAVTTTLSDDNELPDQMSNLEVAATYYRVRDQLMTNNPAGEHYRELYEEHTARISHLLLLNSSLRLTGSKILKSVAPELTSLMEGYGDQVVLSQETVESANAFLLKLAEADRANNGGALAKSIEIEMGHIDLDYLTGMTYRDAWHHIQSRLVDQPYTLFVPVIITR